MVSLLFDEVVLDNIENLSTEVGACVWYLTEIFDLMVQKQLQNIPQS